MLMFSTMKPKYLYILMSLLLVAILAGACGGIAVEETTGEAEAPAVEEPAQEEIAEATEEVQAEMAEATEEAMPEATEAPAEEAMATAGELPEVDPLAVSGDIITAGSSTVFPLSERMAERFQDEGYAGNITIDKDHNAQKGVVIVQIRDGQPVFVAAVDPSKSAGGKN